MMTMMMVMIVGDCQWFVVKYRRSTEDNHVRTGSHQSTHDQHDLPWTGQRS